MTPGSPFAEPEQIRRDAAREVKLVRISDQFTAILACRVPKKGWATSEFAELVATPDGVLLGRCEGEPEFDVFPGSVEDLLRNIHGLSRVVEIDRLLK